MALCGWWNYNSFSSQSRIVNSKEWKRKKSCPLLSAHITHEYLAPCLDWIPNHLQVVWINRKLNGYSVGNHQRLDLSSYGVPAEADEKGRHVCSFKLIEDQTRSGVLFVQQCKLEEICSCRAV